MQNERVPLYIQIQNYFKELIVTKKLAHDDRIPSEKELMEQFGVSRITVANALAELAKDGWIYRIPGRGSFVGNISDQEISPSAKPDSSNVPAGHSNHTPRASSRSMIGLVIPSMEDLFAVRLLRGIQSVLEGDRYYLTIVLTDNNIQKEKEVIRELIEMGAVGLIIFPVDAETYNEEILTLKMEKFPFVLIDRYLPGVETHFVCSDSPLGAKLAVDHLWDLGHRKIAICSDSPLPTITVSDRISGYMDALKEKRALIDPSLILTDFDVDYNHVDEQHPLYRYIKSLTATAFITLNAKLGLYVLSIAKQIGLRVPEDISILTFDDPYPDDSGRLSYINQWEYEIGKHSVRVLMDVIDSQKVDPSDYQKIVLKPELIHKHTTGPVNREV